MAFQSLGYVMKRAAACRVCPTRELSLVRVFVRAVLTEMGKKRGGSESAEKVIFGKKVKNCGGKNCIIRRRPAFTAARPSRAVAPGTPAGSLNPARRAQLEACLPPYVSPAVGTPDATAICVQDSERPDSSCDVSPSGGGGGGGVGGGIASAGNSWMLVGWPAVATPSAAGQAARCAAGPRMSPDRCRGA